MGICGGPGYQCPVLWAGPGQAQRIAARLAAAPLREVTRNPHLDYRWARAAVSAPALLARVKTLIGADIAVENSFLITKEPHSTFSVPAHQDGINDRILLDPAKAVAAWLAITDATVASGCLQLVPGSHGGGYLPYHQAAATGSGGQRPLTAGDFSDEAFIPVPLPSGQACLLDVRLIHRSGPNQTNRPRIGLNVRYIAPGAVTIRDGSTLTPFAVTGTRW